MMPDLAIIGAGPAGLSAAIEARRLGLTNLLLIERESEPAVRRAIAAMPALACWISGASSLAHAR